MTRDDQSTLLRDNCKFKGITEQSLSARSLDAELGFGDEKEYVAEFVKSNETIKLKLSNVDRDALKDWNVTDPIRYYQELGTSEVGFYNERLQKRFRIYSL